MAKATKLPTKLPAIPNHPPKKKSKKKAKSKQKSKQKPQQIVLPPSYLELTPLLQQIRLYDYKNDYLGDPKLNDEHCLILELFRSTA